MLLNKTKRDEVVRRATELMMTEYDALPSGRGPLSHYCLLWARNTILALEEFKLPGQIQAGSAFWRCVREEDDDGVEVNQVGYKFQMNEKSIMEFALGLLPEMHVWVAVVQGEQKELIDLTPPFFKDRCREFGGRWTMPNPPAYLWTDLKNFPSELCSYDPDVKATLACHSILRAMETGGPLTIMLKAPQRRVLDS